ncbi:zinc dependent phospholipase C family protein [Erysipelothrix sp. HDW6C]|nr:zinc dependent phospholipase C family protein [Erysipelothrix sp. HDW6C]
MAVIPNVITHGLMALDVYNKLEMSAVQKAIEKHPKAYLLGSNGPDILFYYKVLPWQDQKLNKHVAGYGNAVHETHINDFFREAVRFVGDMKDPERQDILISYLAGHFLHWSLDSLAHPFIFYRSGEIAGATKFWHYRYESMIDALMITYVKKRDMNSLKAIRFVDVSASERRVIASFYQMMLARVFHIDTEPEVIDEAIASFKKALGFLYDPHNVKTSAIKAYENKFLEPWALSSHIVNANIDAEYDVLNLKHDVWSNPTDINDTSTLSFVDLYDYSIKLGLLLLDRFDDALLGDAVNFDEILNDCQYDTGRPVGIKMKFYNSIYNK